MDRQTQTIEDVYSRRYQSFPYDSYSSANGQEVTIGGFAQDRVRRVDMIVNGEPVPVEIENNAFYAELTSGESVTAVVATLDDGSKVLVRLHSAELAGTVPVGGVSLRRRDHVADERFPK